MKEVTLEIRGPTGHGKTTILNFIKDALAKSDYSWRYKDEHEISIYLSFEPTPRKEVTNGL